ncbi:MAG: SDR family oxidoreductase [Pseudomonadota bacterium]
MKILVVGASGKTGQVLLRQLSQTTHQVTGFIRNPEQEQLVTQFGSACLLGDLENNVNTLVEGFDAIIFVAGSRGKNIHGVDYQGLVNMVDAAVNKHVKRFLYIGSIHTEKEPDQFIQNVINYYQEINEPVPEGLLRATKNPKYHDYVKIKLLAENYLIESGINYTILRTGILTQDIGSGKVNVTLGNLNAFGKISRDNVARCFIEVLKNKNTYRKTYTLLDGETPIDQAFMVPA